MKCTIFAAVSTDGYIADSSGRQNWTSDSDAAFLSRMLKNYDVLVMGRNTFEANISKLKSPTKVRIVLTTKPEYYSKKYPKFTEHFTSKPLASVLSAYTDKNIAILGGSQIYTNAILSGLCDDAYITQEPVLIGVGVPFTKPVDLLQQYYTLQLKNDLPEHVMYYTKK